MYQIITIKVSNVNCGDKRRNKIIELGYWNMSVNYRSLVKLVYLLFYKQI